jgi:hypothetical protein
VLRQDDLLKGQLVMYGWLHGKEHGGHLAAEAIMSVIANRVRAGWGTWLDVLAQAPSRSATLEQPTGIPDIWSPGMVRLLHAVEGIYEGSAKDLSHGAMYFADSTKIDNPWFKDKILGDLSTHRKVADMNALMFFL